MSKKSLIKIKKINSLVETHGKKGIKYLMIFKLLKTKLEETIVNNNPELSISEEIKNEVCSLYARKIIDRGSENPSEDDIKKMLSALQLFS